MTRERRDNGFILPFESVAALRFEKFGKLFRENIRLEHLKQKKKKKKVCICHRTGLQKLFLEVARD